MMKRLLSLLALILIISAGAVLAQNETQETVDMYIFYGKGCPHCSRLITFLDGIKDNYPMLNIIEKETYSDNENRKLFSKMVKAFDTNIKGVPTTFIDDRVIVGFSNSIKTQLEQEIQRCIADGCASPIDKLKHEPDNVSETVEIVGESSPEEDPEKTELTKKLTVPAVLSAAAVDAINPCAFCVLIILLTTILTAGIKRRALFAGLAFTAAIYISYFLMGVGLYSAIQAAKFTHIFFILVAVLAIIVGLFNLKDYLWYGRWFIMEVPTSWRPKLKAVLKGITSTPGAFLIGFVVSLFLLPCTSGPYIVILGLLAKTTTRNYALLLLLVYNFIFILPMLIITATVFLGFTTTEQAEEWRTKRLKVLHLIAGIVILLLGIGMFIALGLGLV